MKKILMIGNSLEVKGGIATVEKLILDNYDNENIDLLPSYIDKGLVRNSIHYIAFLFKYVIRLISKKYNIIYIHISYKGSIVRKSFVILLAKMFDLKIIIHTHGSMFKEYYKGLNKIGKKFVDVLFNCSNHVIVLSDSWKEYYSHILSPEKIQVFRNSVNVDEENKYDSNRKLITFAGLVGKRKGVYDLLDIANDIYNHNSNIKIYIAGNGELDIVKSIIKNNKIKNVTLCGWIDQNDLGKILDRTLIYILPSYNEGLPMSVLEAMAKGLPVITTSIGGLPELIRNNKNGYLIRPGDKNDMLQKVIELIDNREKAVNISRDAHKTILENYNIKDYIKKLKVLLDN